MLVGMCCLVAKTKPAKLMLTIGTNHMHASGILVYINIAFRTFFGVTLLPLYVELVYYLVNLLPPFTNHAAGDRLMTQILALHAGQEATSTRTVFGSKFVLG